MAEISEYSITTPLDTALEGDGAGAVRDLADSIKDRVGLDHNFAGNLDPANANCDGYHNKVTLKKLSADPDLLTEDIGAFTATGSSDEITCTGHGLATGDHVYAASTTTLPDPLVAGTIYYVRVVDVNTLSLYETYNDADNDENSITMTDAGTGTHTLKHYLNGVLYSKDSSGDSGLFFKNAAGVVQIL